MMKFSASKLKFRNASNRRKQVFETAKIAYANKTKGYHFPKTWFLWHANKVLRISTSAAFPHLMALRWSFVSDKPKLLAKNFSKTSNLDDLSISLTSFLSRTNPKLHNIHVTSELVKKVISKLDLSKGSCPDCIPLVDLKKCEFRCTYILAELFNMCLNEFYFPDCRKVSSVVSAFKNVVEERLMDKNYCHVSLWKKNRLAENLKKWGLLSDFR